MFYGSNAFFDFPQAPGESGMRSAADNSELYDVLGVKKDATSAEIKKAFRSKALKNHPDRGGDEETFKAIADAYGILSDDENRAMYDKYGKEGCSSGTSHSHPDFADIFGSMFGNQRRQSSRWHNESRHNRSTKSPPVEHIMHVDLCDLYNGKEFKLRITRKVQSNPDERLVQCDACSGSGMTTTMRRLGHMVQQIQSPCVTCGGKGHEKVEMKKEKKIIIVNVEKGMAHGTVIKCPRCADQEPGQQPGDLHVKLVERPHDVFVRKDTHLVVKQRIELVDALCGTKFCVTHLDGRVLTLTTPSDTVVTPSCTWFVNEEGMPNRHSPFTKGHLFVQFDIIFPTSVVSDDRHKLREILPLSANRQLPDPTEEHEMARCSFDANMQGSDNDPTDADHTDADPTDGNPRDVQCHQS